MRLILKDHNKTAYKKVMAAFEKDRMTCVCHPTGTGKSYIVAAVTEHFKRVLILAPNNFVLRQQSKLINWRRDIEYRTYQWLNKNVTDITERYDLIVLDEFHRAGAPEWSAAVQLLIESQTDAKVLGTSATPIRYLDGERNMADELFNGHVASNMTIAEAWTIYSVLPIPRYVSGLFKWDKTVEDAADRINRNRNLDEEQKRQRIFRLNNKKLDWEKSYGMPTIIRRHLDKDARRVIIFCSHIETLEQMKSEVCGWFREAGFALAGSYILHSQLKDSEQDQQMRGFEADNDSGVKLMFCVDMLNEGIHVPRVSAVLMLRTTSSRIIYMQQMGRCLTAANTEKPLVLDMVDNITTTTAIKDFQEEFELLEMKQAEKEGREPRKFEVFDYTLGVRQLIEKLVPQEKCFIGTEERLAIIVPFCDKNKRLPDQMTEPEIYKHWSWLRKHAKNHPEVQRLFNTYSRFKPWQRRLKQYTDFYNANNRNPRRKFSVEERKLESIWKKIRTEHADDPVVQEYVEKERQRVEREKEEKFEKWMAACREAKEKGRPLSLMREYKFLIWHFSDRQEFIEFRGKNVKKRSPARDLEHRIDAYEKVMQQNGRQILRYDSESLYVRWIHDRKHHAEHPRIKSLVEQFPNINREERNTISTCADVKAFWEKNGRYPLPRDKEIHGRFRTQLKWHRDHPEVKKLLILMNYAPDPNLATYNEAMEFYHQNGCLPTTTTNKKLNQRVCKLIRKYPEMPEAQELKRLKDIQYGRTGISK